MVSTVTTPLTGAAAGLAGLAAAETIAAVTRGPSLVDATGHLVVDLGPRPVIDAVVRLLRASDKPVIRGAVITAGAAAGAALSRARRPQTRYVAVLGAAGLAGYAALRHPPRRPALVAAAASAGAATAAATLLRRPGSRQATALFGAAITLTWARWRLHRHQRNFDDHNRRLSAARSPAAEDPQLTTAQDFYTVDVNVGTPLVPATTWRLSVHGHVHRPTTLSMGDLLELGPEDFPAVMVCVHNQLGWDRVGNATWTGIPLARVLELVQPQTDATTLVTRAVDGYTISLPLHTLKRLPGFVVVAMNGQPLPARHGFPARVFVPGLYGQYTGVKWLTGLELVAGPYPDYWARRGWPREPVAVRPMSRIDSPRQGATTAAAFRVTGVAWAPPQGVHRVDVAVDDGDWQPADLAAELGPASWRRWQLDLVVPAGRHRIVTRAVRADGTVQDPQPRPPFPSGVSGHHTITVTVPAPLRR